MERLQGQDLAELLRAETRFDLARVVALVRDLAAGAGAAHDAGIVHRDLKPQNTFRAERAGQPPVWTILDFGLSKLVDHAATLTHGGIVGTPAYMAPEQARGLEVDRRADVYALAAIAYRSLTGRPPFAAPDAMTVLLDVLDDMPPSPRAFAELPSDVERVLALGLAKDPSERLARAEELALALDAAARGELPADLRDRASALLRRRPWSAK
jgi:serine/threonine-protein kinase